MADLRGILGVPPPRVKRVIRGKTPRKALPAPDLLPIGSAVMFATSGRNGLSPMRPGTVTGYHIARGLWVEIWEDGTTGAIKCRTRPRRVCLR